MFFTRLKKFHSFLTVSQYWARHAASLSMSTITAFFWGHYTRKVLNTSSGFRFWRPEVVQGGLVLEDSPHAITHTFVMSRILKYQFGHLLSLGRLVQLKPISEMTSLPVGDVFKFCKYRNVFFQPLFNCAESEQCVCCTLHHVVADNSKALGFAFCCSDAVEDIHDVLPMKALHRSW